MNQIDSETVSFAPDDAVLVLEDGQVYVGDSYGAIGKTTGEIVFVTGMTGYQETLTDPSYDRQIVVQTFPHIGDTGINREDPESSRIWVAGYVVRDPSPTVSTLPSIVGTTISSPSTSSASATSTPASWCAICAPRASCVPESSPVTHCSTTKGA